MTPAEAHAEIRKKFQSDWGSETPIAFDNLNFDPPADNGEFVRLVIDESLGSQQSVGSDGNRLFRRFGIVFVQIFTPTNTARLRSDELSETAYNIFINEVNGVRFYNQSVSTVGVVGSYYQQNIIAEFIYDALK